MALLRWGVTSDHASKGRDGENKSEQGAVAVGCAVPGSPSSSAQRRPQLRANIQLSSRLQLRYSHLILSGIHQSQNVKLRTDHHASEPGT